MKFMKIFGWILLVFGLTIIVWTLYSSYNIFTGKSSVFEFFKIEEKITQAPERSEGEEETKSLRPPSSQKGKLPVSPEVLQQEIGKMIGEQLKGILPVDALPKILNLLCWSTLSWILIFGGAQISSLGIKLLRD